MANVLRATFNSKKIAAKDSPYQTKYRAKLKISKR